MLYAIKAKENKQNSFRVLLFKSLKNEVKTRVSKSASLKGIHSGSYLEVYTNCHPPKKETSEKEIAPLCSCLSQQWPSLQCCLTPCFHMTLEEVSAPSLRGTHFRLSSHSD